MVLNNYYYCIIIVCIMPFFHWAPRKVVYYG